MPYRAPELFNVSSQCEIDERTDIWSLGCLLFALCFLRGPFDEAYQKGDSLALAANAGVIPFPGRCFVEVIPTCNCLIQTDDYHLLLNVLHSSITVHIGIIWGFCLKYSKF